ncbi:hypothetical protein [Bacillus thuringiensis]|uniref:Uncharacterized protein n=1 Tax=Bacillus thuringiensis DB27 TaxID=1431339 RepID=W8YMD9_BACTU|nr:hypothetical protein [Bacillus thuringiensis]MBG9633500.1 hypothetical protein [Bacillus thuringiensis]MBG9668569.1 hypothetical protein [Bacillus thuringiensis]MBH0355318.1 hypothetical protein [Bacillus thuringiensis]CDN39576.1 unnamed protein product [Bacillus thuringiensis DB27]
MDMFTDVLTQEGEKIKFGDILSSPTTHDVVVLREVDGEPIVQVIGHEEYIFTLKSFVSKWSELSVTGSILIQGIQTKKSLIWISDPSLNSKSKFFNYSYTLNIRLLREF